MAFAGALTGRMYQARGRISRQGGFTFVEFMVVGLVFAIIATIALPSFQNMTASSNLRSTTTDLITAINAARAEAVNLRAEITLRPRNGTDWSTGWVIDYEAGGIQQTNQEFQPSANVTVQTIEGDNVIFRPNGTASREMDFRVCGSNGGRRVQVTRVGRVTNVEQACS